MAINREHEIHSRRFGRNAGVGLALVGMVLLVFALTVVKVKVLDPRIAAAEVTQ